ncbi:MAG: DUF1800 domain-containing protein [Phaeodactylibacter sp.]|nr:DUF1800 domain-containing protein [Phaeodactylibacter sp.]
MEKIQHLYWRAGFGLSPREWNAKQNLNLQQAIDELFREAGADWPVEAPPPPSERPARGMSEEQKKQLQEQERESLSQVRKDWLKRMASPRHSALMERMSLFWHGHFACQTFSGTLAFQQLRTIRKYAFGKFGDLVLAIARDPAMIRFLNNQQNHKDKPNENFARELMELFTIGRGHYTEQDIKEAARAFTGWSSNLQGIYTFRPQVHDYGSKTFFGQSGAFDGTDIIAMILEKRETAQFITRKVYRYFVNEKVDEALVEDLSRRFYDSDYDIGQLMRTIFESDWFYAPHNIGVKIKSPVELVAGIMRTLDVRFIDDKALVFLQRALGQVLYHPPNVAGWAGGKTWIDNATLMMRLNLVGYLFQLSEFNFRVKDEPEAAMGGKALRRIDATVDLEPLMQLLEGVPPEHYSERFASYLLQARPQLSTSLLNGYTSHNSNWDYARTLAMRLMSLPEYQMC